jgi:hypothetical protein
LYLSTRNKDILAVLYGFISHERKFPLKDPAFLPLEGANEKPYGERIGLL